MTGLDDIVDAAWAAHRDAVRARFAPLVSPSIPIAWFGDLEAYRRSSLRVITVGLNPSLSEFPRPDPFERFPRARHIGGDGLDAASRTEYVGALNDYFRERPYSGWFRPSFEDVLSGMGASFYGTATNTTLHTDPCSPLATDPTWSRLRRERAFLRDRGVGLWHDLVRLLLPDVIVMSVARAHLDEIRFGWAGAWETMFIVERTNPYAVRAREVVLAPAHRATVVFERAANKPFGTVARADKRRIGAAILEHRAP